MKLFNDFFNDGLKYEFIDILFYISILFSIFVIISKNPIFSVLFLIGLFVSISLYLISIGLEYIGISYLLVYVGAVSILFLFILMLINIRISELLSDNNNYLPLAIISLILLFVTLGNSIPSTDLNENSRYSLINNSDTLNYVTSNKWDNTLINNDQISSIGNLLYTNYSIWLIIISVILLLAMVGSIVITKKSKTFA